MENLQDTLIKFNPIGLEEMDSMQLLDRNETKFLFNTIQLDEILSQALDFYRILSINDQRIFPYQNTYLDTEDYDFFYQHMTGKLKRYKVRHRTYLATSQSFLEIKCKTNKKRTIKWRISENLQVETLDPQSMDFLVNHLGGCAYKLHKVLATKYERLTLVSLKTKERITIDNNLSFKVKEGIHSEMPFLSIAEIKHDNFSNHSPFLDIMKRMQIHKSHFSKYCMGIAMLKKMPKTNSLKSSILQLNKIKNEKSSFSFA